LLCRLKPLNLLFASAFFVLILVSMPTCAGCQASVPLSHPCQELKLDTTGWIYYICFTCRVAYNDNEHSWKEVERLRKVFAGAAGGDDVAPQNLRPPRHRFPDCTPYGQ
jgi:hypothetical protein